MVRSTLPIGLVAILGMHRSGTSCLAGSLETRGLHLGKVFEWSPHNLKGNRENAEVMSLNESVLEASGGRWDDPPSALQWLPDHAARRDDLVARCTRGQTTTWGFKDPRSVFTLPFWQESPASMTLVGTFRHPLLAARSLQSRDRMAIPDGLRLWTRYNARLLEHFGVRPFPIVSFDVTDVEYASMIERVADHLGLPFAQEPAAGQFLDDSLRHADAGDDEPLPRDVLDLYARLNEAHRAFFASPR